MVVDGTVTYRENSLVDWVDTVVFLQVWLVNVVKFVVKLLYILIVKTDLPKSLQQVRFSHCFSHAVVTKSRLAYRNLILYIVKPTFLELDANVDQI